jgi:hypothetical protein
MDGVSADQIQQTIIVVLALAFQILQVVILVCPLRDCQLDVYESHGTEAARVQASPLAVLSFGQSLANMATRSTFHWLWQSTSTDRE